MVDLRVDVNWPATLQACDLHVAIPVAAGMDSLNVAAASAVAF